MRRIVWVALATVCLTACQDNKPKTPQRNTTIDSLQQIIAQKDMEINDMMTTLNDIQDGFREISEAENRVSLVKADGEGSNSREQIQANMGFIQSTMKKNRQLINKLQQQLREGTVKSEQLRRTVDNLIIQLEEKDVQLKQLRAELESKDIHISQLDEAIAELNADVNSLTEETNERKNTIAQQDKQLNTAWFVFGTKSELKEQHIIEDGKVLQADFNRSYFTKIDIRVDKEIKLYSKSAKLLTAHPAGSYTLTPDVKKQYVLRITDPQNFWSTSKYLVILVK